MTQFDLAHYPGMAGICISITTGLSTCWRCVFIPHCRPSSSHCGCFCFTLPPWKLLKSEPGSPLSQMRRPQTICEDPIFPLQVSVCGRKQPLQSLCVPVFISKYFSCFWLNLCGLKLCFSSAIIGNVTYLLYFSATYDWVSSYQVPRCQTQINIIQL